MSLEFIFPFLFKLLEFILDQTKMSKAQKRRFADFVRQSQKQYQPSVLLLDMADEQEKNLRELLNDSKTDPKTPVV